MRESDDTVEMWTYWRDKKGYADALKDYYPNLLKGSSDLQQAVTQLRNAERAIDAFMEENGRA